MVSCSPSVSEKALAPHSSTLAWKIPWMEEPGGLQPWGRKESDTTEGLHYQFVSLEGLKRKNVIPQ